MSIKENIEKIRKEIPNNVQLICVSKTKPVEDIMEAYNVEERHFGENKVQELCDKYETLPKDIQWHLIGHLQRNKVKYLVGKVALIHSLDSIKLLKEIEKKFSAADKTANVLIQINIGREESKTGLFEEELQEVINEIEKCTHVKVKGIMSIVPKGDSDQCRVYFKKIKDIFDSLKEEEFINISMDILSMGMSEDYNIAIEEGSNMIRVGQGIFGKRNYSK